MLIAKVGELFFSMATAEVNLHMTRSLKPYQILICLFLLWGYMLDGLVSARSLQNDSAYVKVTARVLNIRNKPANNAPLVGQLRYGQVFLSVEKNGNWRRLVSDSLKGWAFAPFLTETAPPPGAKKPAPKKQSQPEQKQQNRTQEEQNKPETSQPQPPDPKPVKTPEPAPTPNPEPEEQPDSPNELTKDDIQRIESVSSAKTKKSSVEAEPLRLINLADVTLNRWMSKEDIIELLGEPTHSNTQINTSFKKELLEYYTTDNRILYLYLRNGLLLNWQLHDNY